MIYIIKLYKLICKKEGEKVYGKNIIYIMTNKKKQSDLQKIVCIFWALIFSSSIKTAYSALL